MSKTRTSFYRRLYVAHLIANGADNVPALMAATGMPRRTAQDTIAALAELDIRVGFAGGKRNGAYQILDWGPINPEWVTEHIALIGQTLDYPV